MKKVKYVKTRDKSIIIFSEVIKHDEFKRFDIISAGFIEIWSEGHDVKCRCYGKSVSLGLESHEEDTNLAYNQVISRY